MSLDIKKVVMQRLVSLHGWTQDSLLDFAATKQYPTAVGMKQASVRIRKDSTEPQYWLNGEYQSEGNNALAACVGCIRADLQIEEVEALVDTFAAKADKTVSETYAARLLK